MDPLDCSDLHQSGHQLHVVTFPWLAHGHISPFIELSKRLAEKSIKISFVSTPLNIANIKPSFAGLNVNLVELPLPQVEGLPLGIESTAHLPSHLIPLFHKAAKGLKKPLQNLLEQISPDVLIFDYILCWASKVALKLRIPAITFVIYGAAYMAYDFCPSRRPEGREIKVSDLCRPPSGFPSPKIRRSPFDAEPILIFYNSDIWGDKKPIDHFIDCYYECNAIAIKSCNELEGKFIDYYREATGRPVVPLGPLLPRPFPMKREGVVHEQRVDCLRWLDKQPPRSVVYASFGSEYFLSKEQIEEIALGLEASQQPFLWVLRFPSEGSREERRALDLLPEGFEGQTTQRGLVFIGWAPQMEILCHPSTGGFLTHCGWSSTMEGMASGLPLISLPMQLDQALNARLIVEEWQVGVEVERGSDGSLNRWNVCRAVRIAMVEEEGRYVRSKAAEIAELFKTKMLEDEESQGSQNQYVDAFVKLLHGLKIDRLL